MSAWRRQGSTPQGRLESARLHVEAAASYGSSAALNSARQPQAMQVTVAEDCNQGLDGLQWSAQEDAVLDMDAAAAMTLARHWPLQSQRIPQGLFSSASMSEVGVVEDGLMPCYSASNLFEESFIVPVTYGDPYEQVAGWNAAGWNATPVAVPVSSMVSSQLPGNDVLHRQVQQLQMDLHLAQSATGRSSLEVARMEAKEDVLRCAQESVKMLKSKLDVQLHQENDRLRGELSIFQNSANSQSGRLLQLEKSLDALNAENVQLKGSSDLGTRTRGTTEDNSILLVRQHASAEVGEVRRQVSELLRNQEELLLNNANLKESGSLREDAILSLQRQLEEEREKVRLLLRDFESLRHETDAGFVQAQQNISSNLEDLQDRLAASESERMHLAEHAASLMAVADSKAKSLADAWRSMDEERESARLLQRELEEMKRGRGTSDFTIARVKALETEREREISALQQGLEEERQRARTLQQAKDDELQLLRDNMRRSSRAKDDELQLLREQLDAIAAQRDQLNAQSLNLNQRQSQEELNWRQSQARLDQMEMERNQAVSDLAHMRNADMQRAEATNSLKEALAGERDANRIMQMQLDAANHGDGRASMASLSRMEEDVQDFVRHIKGTLSGDFGHLDGPSNQVVPKLRGVLDEQQQRNLSLQRDLSAVRAERDAMLTNHSRRSAVDDVVELRRKLLEAESECTQLREKAGNFTSLQSRGSVIDAVNLRKQVGSLETELSTLRGEHTQLLDEQEKTRGLRGEIIDLNRQLAAAWAEAQNGKSPVHAADSSQRQNAMSSLRRSFGMSGRASQSFTSARGSIGNSLGGGGASLSSNQAGSASMDRKSLQFDVDLTAADNAPADGSIRSGPSLVTASMVTPTRVGENREERSSTMLTTSSFGSPTAEESHESQGWTESTAEETPQRDFDLTRESKIWRKHGSEVIQLPPKVSLKSNASLKPHRSSTGSTGQRQSWQQRGNNQQSIAELLVF